jgi:long-chain acyl-CoA synthetase
VNAIVDKFDRLCGDASSRPLIHLPSSGKTLTANDIERARDEYAGALAAAAVTEGHIILSAVGNRPSFIPLLLAAWSRGAAVMPVDEDTRKQDIEELAVRFGAAAIMTSRSTHSARPLDDALEIDVRARDLWQCHPGLGLLKLTSGSSGTPKAVAVPPATMINDTTRIMTTMGIRADDTQIGAIPLSHAYGFGSLVLPLLLQGTAIVLHETFGPQAVVADASTYGARVMPGVPFMFQNFAAHPPAGGWPSSLTMLISAGARLAPEVVREFWEQFRVKVHSFYGTSESGGIAFDHSDDIDDVPTVGWPMPGVAIELRHDAGIPEGHGRVVVRSDAVAPYYVGPDGAVEPLSDGFTTGDYGRLLPDGRLVLAGRVSSFINVAGRKVQPAEVEQQLCAMPGVVDARVLAVADPVRGEQIAAVVAGHADLSRSDIRQFCAGRLPPHKIPRVIVLVPALPLTARGKPDLSALLALVDASMAQAQRGNML